MRQKYKLSSLALKAYEAYRKKGYTMAENDPLSE